MQKLGKINIGQTVAEQLEVDLALENQAVTRLNEGLQACRDLKDNASAELLVRILESEEEHIDWLEAQRDQVAQVGIENYLAQQIR